jgi:RNA polymerase sigma-19 factor, ECF subfamily
MSDLKAKAAVTITQFVHGTFRRYAPELHRYLVRRLPRPNDADDLAQEVFLRLLRVENAELVQKPQAYMYGIAAHVVREFRMRAENEHERVTYDSAIVDREAENPTHLPQDNMADSLDLRRQLENALDQLSPMHRAVVILLKHHGMSYAEAARVTQLSVHTVEKYYFQAKAQLKTMRWDR